MPGQKTYRYVIRADGTIKVVSKSSTLTADTGQGEILVTSTTHYAPGLYTYDLVGEQFIQLTGGQIAAQQAAQQAALDSIKNARQQLIDDIKAKVDLMPANEAEAWQKLGQLLNYDFGP